VFFWCLAASAVLGSIPSDACEDGWNTDAEGGDLQLLGEGFPGSITASEVAQRVLMTQMA